MADPEAEIDVPEAAGLDLQQRAAAAIEAEARRQAEAAERQLSQLQSDQESTAALVGAGIVPFPGQDPGTGVIADDQPVPSLTCPVARPRPCCWKHCGSRKWSAVVVPSAPSRSCCPTGTPKRRWPRAPQPREGHLFGPLRPHSRPYPRPKLRCHLPPGSPRKTPLRRPENFSNCSPNSTTGNGPLPGRLRRRRPLFQQHNPRRKRPSSTGLPIPTVGTASMKDRSSRPFWSPSSAASFPVRSSPTCRSPSIPPTANAS